MDAWPLLIEIVYLLAACVAGGIVFARLKQSPITGYIVAGMLVGGPGGFQVVTSQVHIEAIAELGVALLLFGLGLEFSLEKLRSLGRSTMLGGTLQVVLTVVVVSLVAMAFGANGATAVTVGCMLALSSTAVVLRSLVSRGELDSQFGRTTVAGLLVQDIALVPLAVLVTAVGAGGSVGEIALEVGKTLGVAFGLMLVLYLAITHVVMRFLTKLRAERNREFSVLLAVVIGLGSTALAHSVGLSPALGAFLAGMFLGSSPIALQFRADVASLRTVLLTLFFGAVGMVADPLWILDNLLLVLGVAALAIVGKVLITWIAFRLVGKRDQESVAAALCLGQIGEFAFVLGSIGVAQGTLDANTYSLFVSVAVVSLLATPHLIGLAPHAGLLVARLLRRQGGDGLVRDAKRPTDILLIGFGPAGREALRGLDPATHAVTVIDLNEDSLRDAKSAGYDCVLGDATQEEILLHAGIQEARVVVIATPSPSLCMTLLDLGRTAARPESVFLVRARHARDVPILEQAGANVVACDEFEVGRRLRDAVSQARRMAQQ